ncbi:MAG: LuxR C-terminal-related transcriptional regulator [Robiginitomaculum sp.]|nr:LuxR C-terminal-related transcriptional regulator [Robiginitomaculum sp.]
MNGNDQIHPAADERINLGMPQEKLGKRAQKLSQELSQKPSLELPKELSEALSKTDFIHEGLNVLQKHLTSYGVSVLAYGFQLHTKSYLRSDFVLYTTFSKSIRRTGKQDGGSITYRFGDLLETLTQPMFFDMEIVLSGRGPLFSINKSFQEVYDAGHRYAWLIPFLGEVENGHGLLVAFQDHREGAPKLDVNKIKHFGPLFHKAMIKHKQMARHFKLTKKQSETLASAAKGITAAEFAEQIGMSERAVELRLQQARKKLRAKTTAEAVYKAIAYGILPL